MKKRRIWITLSAVTITLMLTTIFVAQVQARRFGWAAIDGRVVAVAEDEACRDGVIVRIALDGPPIVDDVDLSLWGPGPSNYKNPDGTAITVVLRHICFGTTCGYGGSDEMSTQLCRRLFAKGRLSSA